MKSIITFIWLSLLTMGSAVFAQDSTAHIQTALSLMQNHQFATANDYLLSAIQKTGFQPDLVCLQVDNALTNHFYRRGYVSFYLTDSDSASRDKRQLISFLQYPDRQLRRVIEQYPDYALAYKLLGDFHRLKISSDLDSTLMNLKAVGEIEEKVFSNYNKAAQLGYNDPLVNRWLGNYYKKRNQPKNAKVFYEKNVESGFEDPMTFYQLAEISYREKQYSQSYHFASRALDGLTNEEIDLRYRTLRIAAISLLYLGEIDRFKRQIQECIQLLPDRQECYIALLKYHDEKKNVDQMEEIILDMLGNNPYDLPGYNYLEEFVVKYNRYLFSEKLFENMMLTFEHSDHVMGNIYWYRGNLFFHQGLTEEAKKLWEISRSYFSKFLKTDDPVFKRIGNISSSSYSN